MVVKAEDIKRQGEEQKKETFERQVTGLEATIDKIINRGDGTREYSIAIDECSSEEISKKVLNEVMKDYRQAGWNVEYRPEGAAPDMGSGARRYSNILYLYVRQGTSPKNKTGKVVHASVIEKKARREEAESFNREAKKLEEEIDRELSDQCESDEIWCKQKWHMDAKMKGRIREIYEKAGWQVKYKTSRFESRSGEVYVTPYIIFKRRE